MTKEAKKLGATQASGYGYAAGTSYADIPGITLREYYAGIAMQGILSNSEELKRLRDYASNHKRFSIDQLVAESGVYYADALLEELSKKNRNFLTMTKILFSADALFNKL
jgi:hypothetical protein